NEDCWLQNLVDVDGTDGYQDHTCQAWTYDGHKGTDIRIANRAEMEAGVAVVAPAQGVVLRVRDGEPDRVFGELPPDFEDRDCGNGIVIDHGNGWTSQLCHLKEGSVTAQPGDRLRAGEPVGLVGASGNTEFVHVHMSVLQRDAVIDPFTGFTMGDVACGTEGTSLWAPGLFANGPQDAKAINAGFATGGIAMADIENGTVPVPSITRSAPAIVFFGRASHVSAGDVERITLTGPDVDIDSTSEPVDRPKAQIMRFAGRRAPPEGLPPGTYSGTYEIVRDGTVVTRIEDTITID
ncbi:MAG: M23 family metallopeptidase, partial [Pseudomonadota bacterium]